MRYIIPLILLFSVVSSVFATGSGDTLRSSAISVHRKIKIDYRPENDTIVDNAIVLPEVLEDQADSLLMDWFERAYPNVDHEKGVTGENVSYPDSVYIRRLAMLPTAMELPYNQVVRKYIDLYTQKRRGLVEYLLGLSVFYFPIFEQELEAAGLPLELKYLPIIESALKPDARSRVGATGLWQFMLGTAKGVGLEVNSLVDERCDPIKSSRAAAQYLKTLYDIYKDWTLAIAAYNCGPGNVNKAIKRARGATDYWAIYYQLPKETRGYVPSFIAAVYVMNYYKDHNISPVKMIFPAATDTVQISLPIHLEQIAQVLDIPIQEIRDMNPAYRNDLIPGDVSKFQTLRLPTQKVYAFIDSQDSIAAFKCDSLLKRMSVEPGGGKAALKSGRAYGGDAVYHKIKSGESLSTIAQKYRVSVSNVKEWNGLRDNNIRAGKSLIIYK